MNGLLMEPHDYSKSVLTMDGDGYGAVLWNDGRGGDTFAVTDFVGGFEDIKAGLIRCIGDPNKRFAEDALRMLRAVRFVAQLGFTVEQKTFDAIVANSHRMVNVSRERVAEELFKLVTGKFAVQGLTVLATTGLFAQVFGREFVTAHATATTLERFAKFPTSDPLKGLAMLMTDTSFDFSLVAVQSLKLSSDKQEVVMGAVVHKMGTLTAVEDADVVRLAREKGMKLAVDLFEQELAMGMHTVFGVEFGVSQVFRFRELAPEDVNPVPMVMGRDLLAMGFKPSKLFSQVLFAVETKQLNGEFADAAEALEFARTEMEKA
jgi:poly(A) polymerase